MGYLHYIPWIRRLAMMLASLALVAYLGVLLADLYRSRRELQQIAGAQLLQDTEKVALAIGYFFSERSDDLLTLAESRELSAYFENKALGMSMEYGLASSLDEAGAVLEKFRARRKLDRSVIYRRLMFLDSSGHPLLDVHGDTDSHDDRLPVRQELLSRTDRNPRFHVVEAGGGHSILISLPYRFKGMYSGQLLAWISPETICNHFLLNNAGDDQRASVYLASPKEYLCVAALMPHQHRLPPLRSLMKSEFIRYRSTAEDGSHDHEMSAVLTPIAATSFSLVTIVGTDPGERSSPNVIIAVFSGIGLLILAGAVILIRNGTRNALLEVRLEESRIREQEIAGHNFELKAAKEAAELSEHAKSESEERLKLVLDGSNDGIWDWDITTGRIEINRRWAEMIGYEPGEIRRHVQAWADLVHPDDMPAVQKALNEHLEGRTPYYESEQRIRTKSGEWKWILARGKVVLRDEQGNPLRAAGTHTDITERKHTMELLHEQTEMLELEIAERQQAQEALQRQALQLEGEVAERRLAQEELAVKQLQLEMVNSTLQQKVDESVAEMREKDKVLISQSRQAAMGEMIGNIAHQWRQPINALAMVLGNIKAAYQYNELTPEYLEKTYENGNRLIQKMSTTINDFRNFFLPDKEKKVFRVLEQVDQAIGLIEASLKSHNVTIQLGDIEDLYLTGFPSEYSQVLVNLFSNAREAILESGVAEGKIVVRVYGRDGGAHVAVSDNGGGIPPEIIDKIFDPYFSTKNMGTGIGLYMSKMIIERSMDGRIEVRNCPGGAEFTIITPLEGSPS